MTKRKPKGRENVKAKTFKDALRKDTIQRQFSIYHVPVTLPRISFIETADKTIEKIDKRARQ